MKMPPKSETDPRMQAATATVIPAAAPPRATMSITMIELSCIDRTAIVTLRKCSASSFMRSWRASSAW